MKKITLNGAWEMRAADQTDWLPAVVPGSVYSDLLANGAMEDPYYRDHEDAALRLMDHDWIYRRSFTLEPEDLNGDQLLLVCKGLDTIAEIRLNGAAVGNADNMHRTWTFDVSAAARAGENEMEILFSSPTRWIKKAYEACEVHGSKDAMVGFPHIRKAHCMFGWDWGPRLPDAGIWRDIGLVRVEKARLLGVEVLQKHENGSVTLSFRPETECMPGAETAVRCTVTAPDGRVWTSDGEDITLSDPQLWWPNGLGEQPLYQVAAKPWTSGPAASGCAR